jgi:O-antigen/teichoic acid export membrane protein
VLKGLLSSEFVKNVVTLMTGTALGQVIALGLSVVVTRFYTPEMFASLEHFAMILGVLGVVAGGKYEPAIMLPSKNLEALNVFALAVRIGFVVSAVAFVLTLLFNVQIAEALGNPDLANVLFLVGPTTFLFVFTTATTFWFGRKKNYAPVASSKTLFSAVSEPSKIGLGALGFRPSGLVWSVFLGHVFTAFYLWIAFIKDLKTGFSGVSKQGIKKVARTYQDYPKFSIAGSLLNRTAQWLHIALFGILYEEKGLIAIGVLGLCRRILMTPLNVLSTSFSQVYFQRITELDDGHSLRSYYIKSLLRFGGIGILMIGVVWLIPEGTMTFIFGEGWEPVLPFLKILVFWFAANFTVSSLGFILHRVQQQKAMLKLDATHFSLVLAALLGAFYLGFDEIGALRAFVVAKVIYFAINIIVTLRLLKKNAVSA